MTWPTRDWRRQRARAATRYWRGLDSTDRARILIPRGVLHEIRIAWDCPYHWYSDSCWVLYTIELPADCPLRRYTRLNPGPVTDVEGEITFGAHAALSFGDDTWELPLRWVFAADDTIIRERGVFVEVGCAAAAPLAHSWQSQVIYTPLLDTDAELARYRFQG